jgi:hypothetical protein
VATIEALAPLLQPQRARCVGGGSIVLTARTWHAAAIPPYDTTPAWFGTNARQDSIVSLFSPGPAVIGPGEAHRPFQAAGWIDARLPPTVERPPLDMVVAVSGHFDDPAAATCSRVQAVGFQAPPGEGFPPEAAADSAAWCGEQFVVEGWQVVTGPEGRPIDPLAPQLHRLAIPAGQPFACAGVGMGPLTIRIDLSRPDPVWIESGGRTDIIPIFGPGFEIINGPQVGGPGGVTLSDGEVLDPDRGKPGIGVCPTGDAVSFMALPG